MSDIHYDGFISYRHNKRDTAVAKEVQSGLEHFRIPKALRKQYQKERFERIFRDDEELGIGANLSEQIETALNNSDYLIVICSKEYNESKWCLMEIRTFLKNHDYDHVLCVISEGEPPEIFPEELLKHDDREVEPLACDYRMDFKDAQRTQLPKIVAAMLGCNYDELILRQERYQRRRLLSIFAVIVLLAGFVISSLLYSNARVNEQYNVALKNESEVLSEQSLNYLENKDRYNALKLALSALPNNELNRPVTDEAQYALSKAVYAYRTPYEYAQSWLIDISSEILDFFISRDNRYIIYIDRSNYIHTVDINTHEEVNVFRFTTSTLDKIEEGKSGQVITYVNGYVYAYDYLTGEEVWKTELKYQTIGICHTSHDNKYIAAGDSFALQIMDINGSPYASIPLPDGYDKYISDFVWSDDDKYIAMKLRIFSSGYQIGIVNLEDYSLYFTEEYVGDILYYDFDADNNVHVVINNNGLSTFVTDTYQTIFNNTYDYHIYKDNELLKECNLSNSSMIDFIEMNDMGNGRSLIMGNGIYIFDESYNLLNTYTLKSPIKAVLSIAEEYLDVLCTDGFRGRVYYGDGSASLVKDFPDDIDQIEIIRADTALDNYVLLKDGNLLMFENMYDRNISFYDNSEKFYFPSDEYLINGDKAVMKADTSFYFIDNSAKKVIATYAYDSNRYYHLLDMNDDNVYILYIDDNAQYCILTFLFETGELIDTNELNLYDFYMTATYLSYPFSRSESVFMDNYFSGDTFMAVNNHKLYINDLSEGNRIYVYDLLKKEINYVQFNLVSDVAVESESPYAPSGIIVSDDGNIILTKTYNFEDYSSHYVLMNMQNESVIYFDVVPGEDFCASMNEGQIIISGEDNIYVFDYEGNMMYSIPYTSSRALSFSYYKNRLYCVYPEGILEVYENGESIRKVNIGDLSYYTAKSIRYEFKNNKLYLYAGHSLRTINMYADTSTPIYTTPGGVLGYFKGEILMFAHDVNKGDVYYYLGSFKEYTVDELIQEANDQLSHFQ